MPSLKGTVKKFPMKNTSSNITGVTDFWIEEVVMEAMSCPASEPVFY